MKTAVIITNYNGKELTKKCIESLKETEDYKKLKPDIIVLDNNSSGDDVEYLKKNFNDVKVIANKKNERMQAYNIITKKIKHKYVYFANNDLIFQNNFLTSTIPLMKNKKTFCVHSKVINEKGIKNSTASIPEFRFPNYFRYVFKFVKTNKPKISILCPGGAGIYNRELFVKLKGFNPIYRPAYYEDFDLTYRAFKYGYKCYYQPESRVLHKHAATLGKMYTKKQLGVINRKNSFTFFWINITDKEFLLKHLISLIPYITLSMLMGRFINIKALWQALKNIKKILKTRKEENKKRKLSDKQIISMFRREHTNI